MKSWIITLAIMFTTAFSAFCQDLIDVVYLKNGDVVKGSIIKPLDETGVKIMTSTSDVFTFSAKEVRKVTREKMTYKNEKNTLMAYDRTGFTNTTGVTLGFGVGSFEALGGDVDNDAGYFGIHTINGYHVTPQLSLGVGVGVDFFGDVGGIEKDNGAALVPLYADVRFVPAINVWAPFFYANGGYALGFLETDANGGAMFGIGGGAQWSMSKRTALVGSIGYRLQQHDFEAIGDYNAHYLNVKIGFKF